MSNYKNYLQEILKELKLTTFPTQNVVINFTIFVILFTAAMAIYLGALDLGFGKGTLSLIETLRTSDFATSFRSVTATTTIDSATNTATVTNILLK